MNEYKIGDFAKELGVTHDFLKHYESHGLLAPSTSETGYRYYSFTDSLRVIQCMQLRNLDFSLKEMEDIFNDFNYAKIVDTFDDKIKDYEQQIKELQAKIEVLDFISRQKRELEACGGSKWSIIEDSEFYFYKHSSMDKFISNEETQEVTKSWIQALPFVQSTCVLENYNVDDNNEYLSDLYWGFSTNEHYLKTFNLTTNEVVQKIKLGRTLVYSYYGDDPLFKKQYEKWHYARLVEPLKVLKEHNFQINGDIYQVYFITNSSREPQKIHYFTLIPIK